MPRWRAYVRRFGPWRARGGPGSTTQVGDWAAEFPTADWSDSGSGPLDFSSVDFFDDLIGAVVAIVLFVAAVAVFWWLVLPLFLLILDFVVVMVLAGLGLLARVLLRRPWTVEAVSDSGRRYTRPVVGWHNATREVAAISAEIRGGVSPLLAIDRGDPAAG
ncbi:MAG: hypothetical protein JO079_02405 [Frankiaceae bacterium]|nr:hypothetical protein [Frankiaceae bacterium]MBV9368479.1 hypothetical protein [Frankiales bacterium]